MSKKLACAATVAVSTMLAFAWTGVAMSAPAGAKDTMADCTKFVDDWKAAYNAKNGDTLAGMFDPKKGTYSSMFWTAAGSDALIQGFKQELSKGNTMTSIKCETSSEVGDFSVATGTWAATAKGPDGKDMPIGGHWQTSLTKRDGKRLIDYHTSNMQLPPQ